MNLTKNSNNLSSAKYTTYHDGEYMEVYDMQQLFNQVVKQYNYMQQKVDEAYKEVQEFNKDEEIQKWQDMANFYHSHSLHNMSDKELDEDRAFREEHYKRHYLVPTKAGGNTFVYTLSGTGLGTIIKITCPECGETKDITDFENW